MNFLLNLSISKSNKTKSTTFTCCRILLHLKQRWERCRWRWREGERERVGGGGIYILYESENCVKAVVWKLWQHTLGHKHMHHTSAWVTSPYCLKYFLRSSSVAPYSRPSTIRSWRFCWRGSEEEEELDGGGELDFVWELWVCSEQEWAFFLSENWIQKFFTCTCSISNGCYM